MNTTRTYIYTVVLTPELDGSDVNAAVPVLSGVLTWGRTIDEAYASAAEAVLLHLEGYRERGQPFPHDRPVRGLPKPGGKIKILAVEVVTGSDGVDVARQVA
jgi:predicted RNase H-like HicB family nuclease